MPTAETPMFRQYNAIKEKHRDAVLFFRMGDFYEMFKSDAVEVSRLLNLTLTQRQGTPMCGIPYHAAGNYIGRLLNAGKKIAICEQIELPPDGKGLARREVVEVLSPGTVVDDSYLDERSNNYVAAVCMVSGVLAFAVVDLSTGDFRATRLADGPKKDSLRRELARMSPKEIVIQESLAEMAGWEFLTGGNYLLNRWPDWAFENQTAHANLVRHFGVANLKAFGLKDDSVELAPSGVLIEYLEENARSLLPHIRDLHIYDESDVLGMDEATIRNLEILRNLSDGGERYTLLESLDYTRTSPGARLIKRWLLSPPSRIEESRSRLSRVEQLYHHQASLSRLREVLGGVLDLERLGARLAMDKAHAKDLLAIAESLRRAGGLRDFLEPALLWGGDEAQMDEWFVDGAEMVALLDKALLDDPSILLTEGRLMREGWNAELDAMRQKRDGGRSYLDAYLAEERSATGVTTLKLKYNRVLGWFFETTKNQSENLPERFRRRQSLTGSERYITERLSELEVELASVSGAIVEKERELFLSLRNRIKEKLTVVLEIASVIAELDVLQSFAYAATVRGYVQPTLHDGSSLEIVGGRHPVVESHLPPGAFVPNSLEIDSSGVSFALVTGPNMAGKSTVLRQAALIVLLAHAGSFVPAEEARIGRVDRIFCRVGASDNLARGESTFLVEMNETAHILRYATSASLVIMDEVGRGTGTSDGLAIARAVCEYLLERIGARTLFATHYLELTRITHPRLINLSMAVEEVGDQVVFPKTLVHGAAEASYGIHVAALAGLPAEVVHRARNLLGAPEEDVSTVGPPPVETTVDAPEPVAQPSLFDAKELLIDELLSLDLTNLTPLDSINLLARWQKEINEG